MYILVCYTLMFFKLYGNQQFWKVPHGSDGLVFTNLWPDKLTRYEKVGDQENILKNRYQRLLLH